MIPVAIVIWRYLCIENLISAIAEESPFVEDGLEPILAKCTTPITEPDRLGNPPVTRDPPYDDATGCRTFSSRHLCKVGLHR